MSPTPRARPRQNQAGKRLRGSGRRLQTIARLKQLQYTWLRAVADAHTDFWEVMQNGLDWALEASGLDDAELRARLLALYWELTAYPEVPRMLAALKAAGLNTAILSNGTPEMLQGAVASAGVTDVLDDVLSVQRVGIFKPHKSVYQMVLDRFDCTSAQVLFVSCPMAGTRRRRLGLDFQSIWANRAGEPMDRLPWKPQHEIPDLVTIPDLAAQL